MRPTILAAALMPLLAPPLPAAAQTRSRPAITAQAVPTPAPSPVPDPNPAAPQQTTATFGDWVLRCTRVGAAAQNCELVQGISSQDRTVAQIAIGRAAKGQPLQMTVLVPPSVTLARPAALSTTRDGDPPLLDMAWRRCLPGGCLADAPLPDELLARIRAFTEPARIVFVDAAGHGVALPFSPRGLPQAITALNKGETE